MPAPVETPYLRPAFLTALLGSIVSLAVSALFVRVAQGSADPPLLTFVRASVRTWLVSMGSGIDTGPVTFGLVPVGATLVCIALVARTASWVVADPVDELPAYVATTAGAYGVIAAIASTATASGDVHTSVIRAAFGAFVVGGLGAAWGAVRRHGQGDRLWFTASDDVRLATRAAIPAVVLVLAAAAVVVLVQLLRNLSRAGDIWAQLDPGGGGVIALGIACVLAAPTLVLWTASALVGPGFMLGTDTSVDLTGSQLGTVPGFPLLGALPPPGEFPDWVFVLWLVPLVAGIVAGWRVELGRREGLLARVVLGAAAGAVAGFLLGILIGLSGGAIGPGRMADAGPPVFTPLLLAVPAMAVGGALGALLKHYRGGRAPQPPDASPTGRPRLWKRHQSPGADRLVDES
ncbi:hypothetical protein ASC61_02920 [Aeromicrobium sp. Root344]|uniref:cell division protein PerM n=1 Tax=Aeromicrobium sp. Root344 TaxID=1736521 RepID=UPI0006F87984|nr:DUF6350 family protein [Aeromicrobium sp. Root344]KQV74042.1 hypothetical protein ASC61_02920 [Aeromicrobium sp. Root344]